MNAWMVLTLLRLERTLRMLEPYLLLSQMCSDFLGSMAGPTTKPVLPARQTVVMAKCA